jgi:hypothetical protein
VEAILAYADWHPNITHGHFEALKVSAEQPFHEHESSNLHWDSNEPPRLSFEGLSKIYVDQDILPFF